MTYPALDAFAADKDVRHATFRVFMHLQRECLNHHTPAEVKVSGLADTLGIGNTHTISALNWLVASGYLVEHERGTRGVRRLTLAWSLAKADHSPNKTNSAA